MSSSVSSASFEEQEERWEPGQLAVQQAPLPAVPGVSIYFYMLNFETDGLPYGHATRD